jgi:hypothetical protein
LKSTSKSKGGDVVQFTQTKNQNFIAQDNINLTNQRMNTDHIEESIIEEDIMPAYNAFKGGQSPLINSTTKTKGKMTLFLMKPPKP